MRSRFAEWMEEAMGWLLLALLGVAALAGLVHAGKWVWKILAEYWK